MNNAEKFLLLFGLVSNGKSTLVNAFLGKTFMPVSNLSCTSLVVKVVDSLEEKTYGEAFYQDGTSCIAYDKQAAHSALYYYNHDLQCGGEFVLQDALYALNRGEFPLTLLDTPGINDAFSLQRSAAAQNCMNDNPLSTLLYISHIRTCATADEEACLTRAGNTIRNCGENHWFFAVNGWDVKDKEEQAEYQQKIRTLVKKCGLPQPKIFFISALAALLCRRVLADEVLYGFDKKEFEHLLRYYNVDFKNFGKEKDAVKKAAKKVLIDSGVPDLEEALYQQIKKSNLGQSG